MLFPGRKIEHYDKRFGIIAIEKGYITSDEFVEALKIQIAEDFEMGRHSPIGRILLNLDKMSARQIHEVLKAVFEGRNAWKGRIYGDAVSRQSVPYVLIPHASVSGDDGGCV